MLRKMNVLMVIATLFLGANLAVAQTTMPLNTGYNHALFNPYPTVNTAISPPAARDNYWINIMSYPPTTPPVDRTWVLMRPLIWAPAFPASNWIGVRNSIATAGGVNINNPGYTVFRKCFCLTSGFHDARLNFQVRADDTVQVWFNTHLNQLVPASIGNWNGVPRTGATTNGFHAGVNCLYVLAEDVGTATGFDLAGSVTAFGLLPIPAAGTNQSFEPCSCNPGPTHMAGEMSIAKGADNDEQQVIGEIVKIAEARRAAKLKGLDLKQ